MDLGDIISDAIVYPLNNIKSLIIFILIGVVGGVLGGASLFGMVVGAKSNNVLVADALGVIGIVILIIAGLLILGYALDIIKFGIERRSDGPGIDFVRQIANGIKLIIVGAVYYIVPAVIVFVLGLFLKDWILTIIAIILFILFAFAEFMAKCRLAKYDSLGAALSIGSAIGDISEVGMLKILATVVVVYVIGIVIFLILSFILKFNATIGGILLGIFGVYFVFFYNRAVGLIYSDV